MKFFGVILTCLTAYAAITPTDGAKILGMFPSPSKSHLILGTALLKGLAEKGHEVTMVSPYPLSKPMKNYRDIVMENPKSVLWESVTGTKSGNTFAIGNMTILKGLKQFTKMGEMLTRFALEDKTVQTFLNSGETFDLIILEVFSNEALFALGHHFKAPVIAFSTIGASAWVNGLVGNPAPWAHSPPLILGYSDKMTFLQRTASVCVVFLEQMVKSFITIPSQEKLMREFFKDAPDLNSLMTNTSLVLLNSHISLSYPRPHMPNMIEIGGFHVQPPKKLPADLQKYLDEAKHGVVYFSMGSNLQSKDLPVEIRNAILKSFSKLKQKVLWKWEDESLPGQPDNVKLGKWLPQQDILAHPNVKLFITHGGLLSTTEAISRGVPVLGIPIFGDQKTNMKQAVTLGYGLSLELDNITLSSFSWALDEILNNPKYYQIAKERSALLNDQETKPLDRAVFWVEYVIRHKGAPQLKSAAVQLSWYQYLLFDVILFITTIIALLIATIYLAIRTSIRFIRRKFCNKTKTD